VDATPLIKVVAFMTEDGAKFLDNANLKPSGEILYCYKRLSIVRWATHEARLLSNSSSNDSAMNVIESVLRKHLNRVGLDVRTEDLQIGRTEVERLGIESIFGDSVVTGILVVRQLAVEWIVGARMLFWDQAE